MKTIICAVVLIFHGLAALTSIAQCDTLNIGNDTTLCEGETLILDAGPGYASYLWSNGSTGQFLTVNEPGDHWCEVTMVDSANLVQNGDFSSGNTSFYTDYVWGIGGPWGILSVEGTYVIDVNAGNTHVNFSPCVDHTTGSGLFMIVNGDSVQGENVWCQTIVVEPNTEYIFSGWFTSVVTSNPAILTYFINGEVIETVYLSGTTCNWENFEKQWNSGSNTDAEICIINQNTALGGNDFGIDDIHLLKVCHLFDTVTVSYVPAPQVNLGNDTLLCPGEGLELSAGSGYTSYLWSNGSADSTLQVSLPGYYWVTVTSENGCTGSDTVIIEYGPTLSVELGNDTTLCQGEAIVLDPGSGWAGYTWSTGANAPTILVNEPGLYWVTVEDINGCYGSDTMVVSLSPAIQVDLGPDTALCAGESYLLNLGSGFINFLWQDGSSGNSHLVNSPGLYWVQVTDPFGCPGSDSVIIGQNPSPQIDLGNDTVLCTGTSLVLDPGSQFSSYVWQDNSTLPFYTVTNTGFYSVTVENVFNCSASDEIFVDVTSPVAGLDGDTLLCTGDTVFLYASEGYASYLWQDGSSFSYFPVTIGGTYSVTITDEHDCSADASLTVDELPTPVADLGGDRILCSGSVLLLATPEGPYSYSWNGEPGSHTLEVSEGGIYEVEVSNACGTLTSVSVVTELTVPEVNLGPDQVLGPEESIELDAGTGFDQYLWQDGSTGQFYLVSPEVQETTTEFWVEVWNGPCKNSDTVSVEVFNVKVPNVITPNGDGLNDTFKPMPEYWSGITRHHAEVFNRWGEKIWTSEDFTGGWDGKQNGNPVADGTYFWILTVYYGPDGIKKTFRGTVTVIR